VASLCPADGSSVRAENLVLRWSPNFAAVALTLSSSSGKALWTQTLQNGGAGELLSVSARAAVVDVRDHGGGEIDFHLQDANGNELQSTFYVLSREEENNLQTRLVGWDRVGDSMIKALGLAYVFSSRKLYDEAANQYRLALEQSPKSQVLRRMAHEADLRAGNVKRSREFEGRPSSSGHID
jgi:hypothetical protein